MQKEAIYAIANLTTVKNQTLAKFILDENILDFICYALNSSKNDVLLVALEALYTLLNFGEIYFKVIFLFYQRQMKVKTLSQQK